MTKSEKNINWTIEFDRKSQDEFENLDRTTQKRIDKFLLKLSKSANPRQHGQALTGKFTSFWKYRIGDYRLICKIEEKVLTILVLRIKHRSDVYKSG